MHAKSLTATGGEALANLGSTSGTGQPEAYFVQWLASGKKPSGVAGPSTRPSRVITRS